MSIAEGMLQELAYEIPNTRKMLAVAPEDAFGWRPHEKSMTLAGLVSHIAETFEWGTATLEQEEMVFDIDNYKPVVFSTVAAVLEKFDANVAAFKKSLAGRSDAHLFVPWRMVIKGKVLFEMPRVAVVRSMTINHLIHHRGQLSVYLRLQNVPLPSVYGPTADEAMAY